MSSQFNNCASMEKKELTVNDCQESFEDDPEWESFATNIAEEIELQYFNKTSGSKSFNIDQESLDIKIEKD